MPLFSKATKENGKEREDVYLASQNILAELFSFSEGTFRWNLVLGESWASACCLLLKTLFEKSEETEGQAEGDSGVDPALFCSTGGFSLALMWTEMEWFFEALSLFSFSIPEKSPER